MRYLLAMMILLLPALAAGEEPATNSATLCLQPLGKYDQKMLDAAKRGVEYVYGFDTKVLPKKTMPKKAWYAPRKRYRADILLDYLREDVFPKSGCTYIVGFTAHDISTTKGKHKDWGILGLGEIGGVAGVVSSYRTHKRLKPPHTATRRVVKVVNHEIGHIMGLPHVKQPGCLLNDAEGTVTTVDKEHGLLCASTIAFIERERGHRIPRHETFDWSKIE